MPFPRIYNPVVFVSPDPLIVVTTEESVTYENIQNSQGSIPYEATSIYYQAGNIEQIAQTLEIKHYDSNGNLQSYFHNVTPDPNQFYPSANIDLCDKKIIFDGRQRVDVPLIIGGTANLLFNVRQFNTANMLPNNPFKAPIFKDNFGFFDKYKDSIDE